MEGGRDGGSCEKVEQSAELLSIGRAGGEVALESSPDGWATLLASKELSISTWESGAAELLYRTLH